MRESTFTNAICKAESKQISKDFAYCEDALGRAENAIGNLPSAQPERKKGKWTEKHHAYSDEESVIEEWQSCRCSECGRYDTRPYMYYFSEPNYCSYCGADMRGEQDD